MSGIPEIHTEKASDYKRVIVGGIFGGVSPGGVEAVVFSEERDILKVLETDPPSGGRIAITRKVECELIISPMQMMSIHKWLGDKIGEYEKLFGHIPSPEEVQSRGKRTDRDQ